MRNIRHTSLSFLSVLMLLLTMSSCKKNESQADNDKFDFTGTWYVDLDDGSTFLRYSIMLNADSTAEYAKGRASLTGTYLYDMYRKIGKYHLTPGKIELYDLVPYVNQSYMDSPNKNAYVQIGPQNMVKSDPSSGPISVPIIINSDNKSFSTNYPAECSLPSTDCFGAQKGVYKKL